MCAGHQLLYRLRIGYGSCERDKPAMLDFTAGPVSTAAGWRKTYGANRRFSNGDDRVLISLYVDDREELPTDAQFKFKAQDGTIKGSVPRREWATFETENFHNNSQPGTCCSARRTALPTPWAIPERRDYRDFWTGPASLSKVE